jgi:hypothetical protein
MTKNTAALTIKTNNIADSATGRNGGQKGYGSTYARIEDENGKVIAEYSRTRSYGGAETLAWVLNPATGGRRAIYNKGTHRTIRDAWVALANELLASA